METVEIQIMNALLEIQKTEREREIESQRRELEARNHIANLSQQILELQLVADEKIEQLRKELFEIKQGMIYLSDGVKFRLCPEGRFMEVPREIMEEIELLGKRVQEVTTPEEIKSMYDRTCKKVEKSKIWKDNEVYNKIRAANQTPNYGRLERAVFTEIFGFHSDRHYANDLIVMFNTRLMEAWGTYIMPHNLRHDRPGQIKPFWKH